MEHRWGKRIPTQLSVRLRWRPDSFAVGRLRDVSLSGGFVEGVPSRLSAWTEVHVQIEQVGFHGGECRPVRGYVVRSEATGVAVEWCEFAPPEIRSLIDGAAGFTTHAQVQAAREGLQSGFFSRQVRDPLQRSDPPSAGAVQGFEAALP